MAGVTRTDGRKKPGRAVPFYDRDGRRRIEWHGVPATHGLAFMDGHAKFMRIRKGLHVTEEYTVIPFGDLFSEALACQQEVP